MAVSVEQPGWAQRNAAACARSGLWLLLPLPVGVVLAIGQNLIAISAHGSALVGTMSEVIPVLILLATFFVGGGLWGRSLARHFGLPERPASLAGAAGYALPLLGTAFVLAAVEGNLFEFLLDGWKLHILYGLLFVPAAFAIAAVASGAVVATSRNGGLALKAALAGGTGAALGFLAVTVILDLVGMRVGAPGAEERFTMITVTAVGMVGAALLGSWAVGRVWAGQRVLVR